MTPTSLLPASFYELERVWVLNRSAELLSRRRLQRRNGIQRGNFAFWCILATAAPQVDVVYELINGDWVQYSLGCASVIGFLHAFLEVFLRPVSKISKMLEDFSDRRFEVEELLRTLSCKMDQPAFTEDVNTIRRRSEEYLERHKVDQNGFLFLECKLSALREPRIRPM